MAGRPSPRDNLGGEAVEVLQNPTSHGVAERSWRFRDRKGAEFGPGLVFHTSVPPVETIPVCRDRGPRGGAASLRSSWERGSSEGQRSGCELTRWGDVPDILARAPRRVSRRLVAGARDPVESGSSQEGWSARGRACPKGSGGPPHASRLGNLGQELAFPDKSGRTASLSEGGSGKAPVLLCGVGGRGDCLRDGPRAGAAGRRGGMHAAHGPVDGNGGKRDSGESQMSPFRPGATAAGPFTPVPSPPAAPMRLTRRPPPTWRRLRHNAHSHGPRTAPTSGHTPQMDFRKMPDPYAVCFHILRHSEVSQALFHAVMTLQHGALRDWDRLEATKRAELLNLAVDFAARGGSGLGGASDCTRGSTWRATCPSRRRRRSRGRTSRASRCS